MPFATPTDDSVPGAFFVDSVLMWANFWQTTS